MTASNCHGRFPGPWDTSRTDGMPEVRFLRPPLLDIELVMNPPSMQLQSSPMFDVFRLTRCLDWNRSRSHHAPHPLPRRPSFQHQMPNLRSSVSHFLWKAKLRSSSLRRLLISHQHAHRPRLSRPCLPSGGPVSIAATVRRTQLLSHPSRASPTHCPLLTREHCLHA